MSIATAITNAQNKVAACYTSVDTMGGTLPETQNLTNLPTAIESIPTGGGTTYPGLDTDYTNGLATINKGALQNYSVSDVTETGCIAKYTNVYNNFKIFGNPVVNFETGVVSGFSYDNYIQLPQSIPTYVYCTTMDMIFLMKVTDLDGISPIISQPSDLRFISVAGGYFYIYIGSSIGGTTLIEANKNYWFRVTFDGTTWKGYLLEDDDYILSQLPDISQWSLEWTTTTDIFRGQQLVIGRNYGQSSQYIRGSHNLSQAVIYVNGVEWWNAKGNSAVVSRYVYNNYTTVGSPTIDINTGLVKGFSLSNYVTLPNRFDASSNTWEMVWKVNYVDSEDQFQAIFGSTSYMGGNSGLSLATNDGKCCLWLSENGTDDWAMLNGAVGTTTMSNNTTYYIKISFTGTHYLVELSTDGTTWNTEIDFTSSTPIHSFPPCFGQVEQWNDWHGSIDLSETYIKINNEIWWTALGKDYKQTYGLLNTNIPSETPELQINYNPVDRNYALCDKNAVVASIVGDKAYVWGNGGLLNFSGYSNYPSYSISPSWSFIGTPTYNSRDMSYSRFNENNYIRTNYDFLMSTTQFAKGFTIQMHIKTPSDWGGSNDHNFIFSQDGNWQYYSFFCVLGGGYTQFVLATGGNSILGITGSTALSTNTEYWIRVVKPDTRYFTSDTVMQISTDGINWATDATSSVGSISTDITNGKLRVGSKDRYWYMRGAVYLDGTFIEFNNGDGTTTRVWDMVEQTVSAPEPSRIYNNFNVVGAPIINQSSGVVSGFNNSNYLTLPQSFNPSSNSWEMMYKVIYTSDNGHQRICGAINNTSVAQIVVGTSANKLITWISSNGTSWDIASGNTGPTTLSNGVLYYIKVEFTGTQYIISLSTDKITWNQEIVVNSSTPVYNNQSSFLVGNAETTNYWKGSIDLSESYIKINGNTWWVGYTES